MSDERKEARERGFDRLDDFAKYRVDMKRELRKRGININKEISTKELERLRG